METGEDRKLLRPRANADPAWSERLRCELNEAQFKFATADDAVILGLAGPGSGKTRALVYRAAHLIKCGVPPGEILLLTFTNKAAEEMIASMPAWTPGTVNGNAVAVPFVLPVKFQNRSAQSFSRSNVAGSRSGEAY